MDKLLYGAAYYDEYMPYERLETDIDMMIKANINTIRIAESTWSTEEPEEGVFNFSHITKVLDICEAKGIYVIIGTPTYAIPPWMAKAYPEVMVEDRGIRRPYGARQIMDITHPTYLFFAERIIRKLMKCVDGYNCVIGFQLDNETKHFGTSSENVQQMFVRYLRKKYEGNLDKLNYDYGLNYWSNRINSWEEFPSVVGTINGSLGCEFEKFQRTLVTDFLNRQSEIVREYKRDEQFITHNFDFAWKGHSYGVQPAVNHFDASNALTIAGCDIYHPSQDDLTGREIAFCGDLTRGLKNDNYLVIETQAQGFSAWTPYPGQLRLQAFSHLANGADCVMYWHWHSIHNACETYWKGILSHDLKENEVYREACLIGKEFSNFSQDLLHLKKNNKIAIMVSNESLTALSWFPFQTPRGEEPKDYNDIVRWIYDALYKMNIECDIINYKECNLDKYEVLFAPALYSADKECLERIKNFAKDGGVLFGTFKTAFTDENVKVWADTQPYTLSECFGIRYDQFTTPTDVYVQGDTFEVEDTNRKVNLFMELVDAKEAEVISHYNHYKWNKYAAVTRNAFGQGTCIYLACMTSETYLQALIRSVFEEKGLWTWKQKTEFPIVIREGQNQDKKSIIYYLNYSEQEYNIIMQIDGTELVQDIKVKKGDILTIKPWDLLIIKE